MGQRTLFDQVDQKFAQNQTFATLLEDRPTLPTPTVLVYVKGVPGGIAAIMVAGRHKRQLSQHIVQTTAPVAELSAIKMALEFLDERLKKRDNQLIIFTDLQYAAYVLTGKNAVGANQELIELIFALIDRLQPVNFIWIPKDDPRPSKRQVNDLACLAAQDSTRISLHVEPFTR